MPAAVADVARRCGIPLFQPASLKDPEVRAPLFDVAIDVLVVAAYGLLLPQRVLDWPRFGCLNVHASLLPRWRGAAPIERAIEAGDPKTGITIMQMDAGLDTGPIVSMTEVSIEPRETAGSLTRKLSEAGATAIVEALRQLACDGIVSRKPQPSEGVSYARKIEPHESVIGWRQPATAIERKLRAFDPAPGAYTWLGGERLKLWSADVVSRSSDAAPGTVVAVTPEGIDVVCGEGTLRILKLQPAGRRRMSAAAFLAGRPLRIGTRFSEIPPGETPTDAR